MKSNYILFLIGIFIGFIFTNYISYKLIDSDYLCFKNDGNILSDNHNSKTFNLNLRHKKNLVYVGVMTANKYVHNRAVSVYETWGKYVPGKITFFTSEFSDKNDNIPLIRLKGVTDTYPPQKKSFMMLKYMYDNHIDNFEFFMRTDDDIFVRTERLEKFLKSLNSSRPYYIGQAGIGNDDEFGHLSLNNKENFCMGGPGVILSRYTLQKIAPHIKECFKSMKSNHEDVEIGRCVQKYAGIPCTWSYEMQNIFYHNYSGDAAFTASLKQREVHRAITMHPIKNPFHLRRVDAYVKSLIIKEKEFQLVKAMKELRRFNKELTESIPDFDDPKNGIFINQIGAEDAFSNTYGEEDIPEWDFISKNVYRLKDLNPKHRPFSYHKEEINDVVREVMETINRLSKEKGRLINFQELLYGYFHNNPTSSSHYIIDMLLIYKKYRGKKMTVPVRRHTYIQVPYSALYVQEYTNSYLEEKKNTDFLSGILNFFLKPSLSPFLKVFSSRPPALEVPYGGKQCNVCCQHGSCSGKTLLNVHSVNVSLGRGFPTCGTFAYPSDDFERICLKTYENVELIVVSFEPRIGEEDTRLLVEALLGEMRNKYPQTLLTHLQLGAPFARASALEIGASQCDPDDLLFFIDVDITFDADSLNRIRWHTIQGKQVYYPIVFSEYDPSVIEKETKMNYTKNHFVIDEEVGYWRAFGYGIVSLYQSDLRRVGGLNTSIIGWGKEDVDLFEKVLKEKNLTIFRAPDPGMVHIYHPVDCDSSLKDDQYEMCQGTRYNTFASSRTLFKILDKNPNYLNP